MSSPPPGVKEQLRRLLNTSTIEQARHEKMILGCYVLAADMEETWRLWATIEAWWPAVEVLISTRSPTLAPRQITANTSIKHIKPTGRGYRNPCEAGYRVFGPDLSQQVCAESAGRRVRWCSSWRCAGSRSLRRR
jgi:hypothetical protein